MDNRLRLKVGSIELEYEGSAELPNEKIINLVSELLDLLKNHDIPINSIESSKQNLSAANPSGGIIQGTTATIAAKVGGGSGSDLAIAAAAYLTFVSNQLNFTRQELLTAMKLGSGYYKSTYNNNLSVTLQTLVKNGKLLETTKNNYSLSNPTKEDLKAKLSKQI